MSVINQMLSDLQRRHQGAAPPAPHAAPGAASLVGAVPPRPRRLPRMWPALAVAGVGLALLGYVASGGGPGQLESGALRALAAPRPSGAAAGPEAGADARALAEQARAARERLPDRWLRHDFHPPAVTLPPAPAPVGVRAAGGTQPAPRAARAVPDAPPLADLRRIRTGVEGERTRFVFEFEQAPRAPARSERRADGSLELWFEQARLAAAAPALSRHDRVLREVQAVQDGDAVRLRFVPQRDALEYSHHQLTWAADYPHWLVVDLHAPAPAAAAAQRQPPPAPRAAAAQVTDVAKVAETAEAEATQAKSYAAGGGASASAVRMSVQPRVPSPREQVQQLRARSRRALARGDFAAARAGLSAALQLLPEDAGTRELLAHAQVRAGDLPAAIATLEQGVARPDQHARFARPLARLLVETGELPRALALLRSAYAENRHDGTYLALLAAAERAAGEYQAAADHYLQALARDRRVGPWWIGLGMALEELQRDAEALAAFTEARRIGGLERELNDFVAARIAALNPTSAR